MKTLKTILLLLALACASNSVGQTKEETITWLKEKLGQHMEGHSRVEDIRLVYINECEMTFTYVVNFGTAGIQNRKLIMPINLNFTFSPDGKLYFSSDVVQDINTDKGWVSYYSNSTFKLANREADIRNRVEKALKHLATFCEKRKETF
jgi:hypothetical protein